MLNVPNRQDNFEEDKNFRINKENEKDPITMEDFEKAISRMKNGKSHEDDVLPVELLRAREALSLTGCLRYSRQLVKQN